MEDKLQQLTDKVSDVFTAQTVQNEVFGRHEVQQGRDFDRMSGQIASHESNNKARDALQKEDIDHLRAEVAEVKSAVDELKGVLYKATGGMAVLLFIFQNWDKVSKLFGGA